MTGQLIDRAAVVTAAQQLDPMKRARDARRSLRAEGIVIFGPFDPHPDLAEALGLPRPTLARFVSARLVRWSEGDPERHVTIQRIRWRLARDGEHCGAAPELPAQGRDAGSP